MNTQVNTQGCEGRLGFKRIMGKDGVGRGRLMLSSAGFPVKVEGRAGKIQKRIITLGLGSVYLTLWVVWNHHKVLQEKQQEQSRQLS